jgi:hypothetical protein
LFSFIIIIFFLFLFFFVKYSRYCPWESWDFKRSRVIQNVCCGPVNVVWVNLHPEDIFCYKVSVAGWLYIVMCHVSYLQDIKRCEEYLAVLELFGSKLCVDGTAS